MTYYVRQGSRYTVTSENALDIHTELPAATYTVKYDDFASRFFLEQIEDFELTGKIYGDTNKNVDRVLGTFLNRENSTGVLLAGEKGGGKTLFAKRLSMVGRETGIPTLVINNPWCGEEFNVFLQSIEQATIIIFDEFEKVYDSDSQEKMLTLLDGVYPSKKLFVLTCNDKYRINNHMKNRPGRIFYRFDYAGLSTEFIEEYCQDNLENKDQIPALCRLATAFGQFNFDILKAVVEEMNRYGETPAEVIEVLNARPEYSDSVVYNVELAFKGKPVPVNKRWNGNPLIGVISMDWFDEKKDDYMNAQFNVSDLRTVDAQRGEFEFVNGDGYTLSLVKPKTEAMDWNLF